MNREEIELFRERIKDDIQVAEMESWNDAQIKRCNEDTEAVDQLCDLALKALGEQWISVPKEPTDEMIQAWHDRMIEGANYIDKGSVEYALYVACYKAMLSAAPPLVALSGKE